MSETANPTEPTPWAPWKIPEEGPPCLRCRFWKPQFRYMKRDGGADIYDGVRMCQAIDMMHDFSCFRAASAVNG